MERKPGIMLKGYCVPTHGYGKVSVYLARHLVSNGIPIRIRHLGKPQSVRDIPKDLRRFVTQRENPWDWEVIIAPPGETPQKKAVYVTMWESTRLYHEWVGRFNQCKALIVPSEWCQTVFDANGVDVPIHRVALGVDHTVFRPELHGAEQKTTTKVFGAAGRTDRGGIRKGFEIVVEAFTIAFPDRDDVRLQIKISPDCTVPQVDDNRISFIRDRFTEVQLADWYRSLTAFVSGSRSEGFDLLALESMACGTALIATRFSGHNEFVTEHSAACVPYTLVPSQGFYDGLGLWSEPDLWGMVDAMRRAAASELTDIRANGQQMAENFSWDRMGMEMLDVFTNLGMFEKRQVKQTESAPESAPVLYGIGPAKRRSIPEPPPISGTVSNNNCVVVGPHWESCGVGQYTRQVAESLGCRFTGYGNPVTERVVLLHHHRHYWEELNVFGWLYELYRSGHEIVIDVHDPGGIEQLVGYAEKVIYHTVNFTEYCTEFYPKATLIPMMCPTLPDGGLPAMHTNHKQNIVWFGLHNPHKGLDLLIQALGLLRDHGKDIGLTAFGAIHNINKSSQYTSTRTFDECRRLVSHLGLEEYVALSCEFLSLADIGATLRTADVCCLPYLTLVPGNTSAALACLAAEKPLVLTPVPMFKDLLGHCALEIKEISVECLASALEELLGNEMLMAEWTVRAKIGHEARKAEVVCAKYREVISSK